jgi:hypothetical protein
MEFYEGEGSLNTRIQHALVYIGKGSMPLTEIVYLALCDYGGPLEALMFPFRKL